MTRTLGGDVMRPDGGRVRRPRVHSLGIQSSPLCRASTMQFRDVVVQFVEALPN